MRESGFEVVWYPKLFEANWYNKLNTRVTIKYKFSRFSANDTYRIVYILHQTYLM